MNVKMHITYFAAWTEFCMCRALGQAWAGTGYWEVSAGLWGIEKPSEAQMLLQRPAQPSCHSSEEKVCLVDPIQADCLEEGY